MTCHLKPGFGLGNYGNILVGGNREPDSKDPQVFENDDSGQEHEQLSVLIVDDHADFLESLQKLLEWSDYRVYVAGDVASAEKATRSYAPNIALVDVKLGTDSGLDLVPGLKQINPGMPCVVMTAYRDHKYALSAFESGADEFLYKPFNPENLLWILNNLLGKDERE